MINESEKKEYKINWSGLFFRILIFTILLILLIFIVSRFTSKAKKCERLVNDYYVVSYFTLTQYNQGVSDNKYQYKYTLELFDIDSYNSEDVSIVSANYFHSTEEYQNYFYEEQNSNIINQNNIDMDNLEVDTLMSSSLKAENFTFEVSDVYEFGGNYYIDVMVKVTDYSNIDSFSDVYFIPIHFNIEYTETVECKK